MSIVTISRGSYSRGKEVAERVAERLGYDCLSRDVLLEASEHFNTAEIKLVRAIHDAPSILDRFTYGREKYIAYIRAALLKQLRRDNIVYHGLAGHFFVADVPHVLRVRIISDIQDRVKLEMTREWISESEALRILKNDDEQRRRWSISLYGIDTSDSSLYDLVVHVKKITVEDAVDIICNTAGFECFKTTPASQKAVDDLALAAVVKAALIDFYPHMEVSADDGVVQIKARGHVQEKELAYELERVTRAVPGVKEAHVKVVPITIYSRRS